MTERSSQSDGTDRTTDVLLVLILVTLAAGFTYIGDGTDSGTQWVAGMILSTMLWLPLLAGGILVLKRL